MGKRLKNLLISTGQGYHPGVRLLHSMVKDKSDSRILIFQLHKQSFINEDMRIDSSMAYNEFSKAFDLFEKWILENQFELIGISFMSHHWDVFIEITKIIRKVLPGCKIVAGGVHAWLINPLETLEHCDYVCAAEGEEVYKHLVDALSDSMNIHLLRIPGLIERHNGEIIRTPIKEYMAIDVLPIPTVGSKDIYYLNSSSAKVTFKNNDPQIDNSFACVHIGRGCPFKCTYCINSLFSEKRKVRVRSVDKVIEEIKCLLKFKRFKALIFMDEIFPMQSDWLKEFADAYKKKIGIPFQITLYPGMLDYEKAKLLKEAGLREVSIGIQSGSEKIRKNIYERGGTNSKILEGNTTLSELEIMTYYDFIIKNPFESEYDYDTTLELVSNFKRPFYLKFYTLAYYPKHPITEMALRKKLIDEGHVKTTIGYLDFTTPHKVAIADHYESEYRLRLWNNKLIKEASGGSTESLYLLLTSCYGYWFIPKFVIEFIKHRFKAGDKRAVVIFASFIQFLLMIRNNYLCRKLYLLFSMYKEKGFLFTADKAWKKIIDTIRLKVLRQAILQR